MNATDPRAPLLAYDGDCGFCAWWVRYWRRLIGERVLAKVPGRDGVAWGRT